MAKSRSRVIPVQCAACRGARTVLRGTCSALRRAACEFLRRLRALGGRRAGESQYWCIVLTTDLRSRIQSVVCDVTYPLTLDLLMPALRFGFACSCSACACARCYVAVVI
jgi:hypothetical protein